MTIISRATGTLSADVSSAFSILSQDGNLTAGEALGVGDACYIKSDGLVWAAVSTVWQVTGSYGNIAFDGITLQDRAVGEPVTLFSNGAVITEYAAGMTPGTALWVTATKGALGDARVAAATTDSPVAKAVSATDIKIIR